MMLGQRIERCLCMRMLGCGWSRSAVDLLAFDLFAELTLPQKEIFVKVSTLVPSSVAQIILKENISVSASV